MGRQPKQDRDQLENLVEEFRIKRELTRQELADLVGVHYQTMSYIERGEYAPTLALALRLAAALDCKVEQLFKLKVIM
jgi:DNA-binding XRE family transcriptional regulator